MKCSLCFSDECTHYIINYEELYDGPNDPLIHFSFFTYQGRCEKHVIIPNVSNLCKLCEKMTT